MINYRKLSTAFKDERGAIPVFESAFIYPLVFLVIFFLILLALLFWKANVDYADLRVQEAKRIYADRQGGSKEAVFAESTSKDSGLIFIKRETSKHTSFAGNFPFHSGEDIQIIQQVTNFLNESDWDLWHLQSLQAWLQEIKSRK